MRWMTIERVQIDRMASAWLIRRFVDADAEFSFVPRETPASAVDEPQTGDEKDEVAGAQGAALGYPVRKLAGGVGARGEVAD